MLSGTGRCLLLLQRCKNMKHLVEAHALAITCGLGDHAYTVSRLLNFCAHPTHGSLSYAHKLFQHVHHPTICMYNTMLKALLLKHHFPDIIHLYTNMLTTGMYPDHYTLHYILRACANLQTSCLAELIHGSCLKLGYVFDEFVGNALITVYCQVENLGAARKVFDEMPNLSVVSWNIMISWYAKVGDVDTARLLFDEAPLKDRGIWGSMISGYAQNNCFKECLYMFQLIQLNGIQPDEGILLSILCACAGLGALDTGIWIHGYLNRLGFPLTAKLGTSLIDMYAKCGSLHLARRVFDCMRQRDTECWNAMISGLAMHGDGESALELFWEMERTGLKPDDITFIAIFTACSYSGLADAGLTILDRMCNVYNIKPKSEHYGCIVDLLSRAGLLAEARRIIQKMPNSTSPSEEAIAWRALLTACSNLGEIRLAEAASDKLLQLELHSGVYVLLSNLYTAAGKYGDAKRVRMMMKNRGVDKTPGCSSLKVNGMVHEFVAGELTHPQMRDIHFILEMIDKQLDDFGCNTLFSTDNPWFSQYI